MGNLHPRYTIIRSDKSWIEGIAIEQLKLVSELKGMKYTVGLPDLHAGPIGIAARSEDIIYPHLVGNDIGCGMGFWKTNIQTRKVKQDKWEKKLVHLDNEYDGPITDLLSENNLEDNYWNHSLGTIGRGNHFAEFQCIENVLNEELFNLLDLDKSNVYLLVHSGSRGLGKSIMDKHISKNGAVGLVSNSFEASDYLNAHNYALRWAIANRELIAKRFFDKLSIAGEKILDANHNYLEQITLDNKTHWIHRKGAAPATEGPVIIPGSRGSYSYLVQPTPKAESNFSIAHGAGRKWKRNEMLDRLKTRKTVSQLTQTELKSKVICEDKKLLYEEAPEAYKNIESVIYDLESFGLIKTIARLKPIITYKMRKGEKCC